MKSKTIAVIAVTAVIMLILCGAAIITQNEPDDPLYQVGKAFRFWMKDEQNSLDHEGDVLARYGESEITVATVAYRKQLKMIYSDSTEAAPTDYQIVNEIARSMMIREEVNRRGLDATQEEIDAMISNAELAYSLPDGKEILDPFLTGAEISFDEYLQLLRMEAPAVIAKQKLIDAVGMEYCAASGIEFTKINPPAELTQAQNDYLEELFANHKSDIVYYIDIPDSL